ncbi:hypothetical protein FGO68_gene4248 [Halteria grandinella]|uniref:Uncharacterized protein n=1 Tax=Halteria grandinella TaxID=5974 RepID=A0A8J8NIF4_HALGN|nr:hypothetical protein FGO68_gene4248 [Halteria grandinella]
MRHFDQIQSSPGMDLFCRTFLLKGIWHFNLASKSSHRGGWVSPQRPVLILAHERSQCGERDRKSRGTRSWSRRALYRSYCCWGPSCSLEGRQDRTKDQCANEDLWMLQPSRICLI